MQTQTMANAAAGLQHPEQPLPQDLLLQLILEILKGTRKDEREALGRQLVESGVRSYALAQGTPRQPQGNGEQRFAVSLGLGDAMMAAAIFEILKVSAGVVGGAAGWIVGGGSVEDIPWGDIIESST